MKEEVLILHGVIRKAFLTVEDFKRNLDRTSHVESGRKSSQAEREGSTKVLKWDDAWPDR